MTISNSSSKNRLLGTPVEVFRKTLEDALRSAIEMGDTDLVKQLVKGGADPDFYESTPLYLAVKNNYQDIVEFLLPYSSSPQRALLLAAQKGYSRILSILISGLGRRYSTSTYSEALRWAVWTGHLDCVKLLIPVSNPNTRGRLDGSVDGARISFNLSPLHLAVLKERIDIVEELLPVTDFKITKDEEQVFETAVANGDIDMIKLLIPHINPKIVKSFQKDGLIPKEYLNLIKESTKVLRLKK
jgi:ankyrin repeat protein